MGYSGLDLDNKVAVVIGGTSLLGGAIMLALAEAGADVVPTSRRAEHVDAAAAQVEARGRRSLRAISDVTDRASLELLLESVVSKFGHVDILVNAACCIKHTATI